MPLYEYVCDGCGRHFELIRKFSDPPVETCIACGGPVRKLLSSPAIQFKGTGWYITDYARKGQAATAGEESGGAAKRDAASADAAKPASATPKADA
jgi:putative FmdB family regulatory protein